MQIPYRWIFFLVIAGLAYGWWHWSGSSSSTAASNPSPTHTASADTGREDAEPPRKERLPEMRHNEPSRPEVMVPPDSWWERFKKHAHNSNNMIYRDSATSGRGIAARAGLPHKEISEITISGEDDSGQQREVHIRVEVAPEEISSESEMSAEEAACQRQGGRLTWVGTCWFPPEVQEAHRQASYNNFSRRQSRPRCPYEN